jgi:hypothetical protein
MGAYAIPHGMRIETASNLLKLRVWPKVAVPTMTTCKVGEEKEITPVVQWFAKEGEEQDFFPIILLPAFPFTEEFCKRVSPTLLKPLYIGPPREFASWKPVNAMPAAPKADMIVFNFTQWMSSDYDAPVNRYLFGGLVVSLADSERGVRVPKSFFDETLR